MYSLFNLEPPISICKHLARVELSLCITHKTAYKMFPAAQSQVFMSSVDLIELQITAKFMNLLMWR